MLVHVYRILAFWVDSNNAVGSQSNLNVLLEGDYPVFP